MAQLQVYRAQVFQGGRNTQFSPYDVDASESPDDLNVDGQVVGAVRKRLGIYPFGAITYGADAITGLYRYYKTNLKKYLMVLCGHQLWAGEGTPPTSVIIDPSLTAGSWMTFATMQDWCYYSNYLDKTSRFDGTDNDLLGLASPIETPSPSAGSQVRATNVATATGQVGNGPTAWYKYGFRFRYGQLGTSNIGPTYLENLHDALNAVLIEGLGNFRPGAPLSGQPAVYYQPTHLQIWRTLQYAGPFTHVRELLRQVFYYIDEIPFPVVGPVTYTDEDADVDLITRYEGNTHSEPQADQWAGTAQKIVRFRLGYSLTPKAKYITEHRNRLFAANCKLTEFIDEIGGTEVVKRPSRVYWSDLYQPDRITGFVDVFPEDGDEITGIASFHNNLVIFKRTNTYLLLGSDPTNFETRLANGYIGCVAPRSTAYVDDRLLFLGHDGVYAFDGSGFDRISNKIRPDILSISHDDKEFAAGGSWLGRYYLAYKEPV